MVRKSKKHEHEGMVQNKPAKKPREHKRHDRNHRRAQFLESSLKSMISPGSECDECGRLYSMDDVLYRGKNMIMRLFDSMTVCSDCAEQEKYPRTEEPVLCDEEIEEYLQIRRSVAPFPWLKELKTKLFKELHEELYKPERVQKWLEAGHDLDSYLN